MKLNIDTKNTTKSVSSSTISIVIRFIFSILGIATSLMLLGVNAYIGVFGLMALFSGSLIITILVGLCIEFGKSYLIWTLHDKQVSHKTFSKLTTWLLVFFLIIVTISKTYGFWTHCSVKSTENLKKLKIELSTVNRIEAERYNDLKRMDESIKNLPSSHKSRKLRELKTPENKRLKEQWEKITKKQSDLKRQIVSQEINAGPLSAFAKDFNIAESVTRKYYTIFFCILVELLLLKLIGFLSSGFKAEKPDQKKPVKKPAKIENQEFISAPSLKKQQIASPKKENGNGTGKNKTGSIPAKTKNAATGRNQEMQEICQKLSLSPEDLRFFLEREKIETVKRWFSDQKEIPLKELRKLRKLANSPRVIFDQPNKNATQGKNNSQKIPEFTDQKNQALSELLISKNWQGNPNPDLRV